MTTEIKSHSLPSNNKADSLENLISKTKNKTNELYSQSILKNDRLQTSIKKINEFSEPFIKKYSALINEQIDTTLNFFILHKDNFKLLQKISEAKEKFIDIGDKVLGDVEIQVSKYYNAVSTAKEEEFSFLQKNDEVEANIKLRMHTLIKKMNDIAKFWFNSIWAQLKNQKIDKESIKKIMENAQNRLNFWENVANAKILMELSYEYLSQEIVFPSVKNIKFKLSKTQKSIILTVEGLKQRGLKEIIQDAHTELNRLKDISVVFYQNKVLIHISKDNLKALGDNSRKALMSVIEKIKDTEMLKKQVIELKKLGVEKSMDIYLKTLENIKQKKEEVKVQYKVIAKALKERKMEKESLRQNESHEDKSTDHNSDGPHE